MKKIFCLFVCLLLITGVVFADTGDGEFAPSIKYLPCRGATLYLNPKDKGLGEEDVMVDIYNSKKEKMQENVLVERIGGIKGDLLTANVIDLMYYVGEEITVSIKEKKNNKEHTFSLVLKERYPWMYWIFEEDQKISMEHPRGANFSYEKEHPAWDFFVPEETKVFSAGVGFLMKISKERENVQVYNPYVGAIILYGYITAEKELKEWQWIDVGDLLGRVTSSAKRLQLSVIRPFFYKKNKDGSNYLPVIFYTSKISQREEFLYDMNYFQDPFYYHEPTACGYWERDAVPDMIKREMRERFKRDNKTNVFVSEPKQRVAY